MKALPIVIFVVLASGLGYFGYEYWKGRQQPVPPPVAEPASPSAAPTPEVSYPVPTETTDPEAPGEQAAAGPLPKLDESDDSLEAVLVKVLGPKALKLVYLDEVIRRAVATVEALATPIQPSDEASLFKPLDTEFSVAESGDARIIDAANFKRYAAFVELAEAVDVQKLVALYVRFYPLIQSAYDELGTKRYFNDRLVLVIDLALGAPMPEGPIKVVKPGENYRYKYEDERLENLLAVQKVLVRMGPENARAVKAKLRVIRARLVALKRD